MKRVSFLWAILPALLWMACTNDGQKSGTVKTADTTNYTNIEWIDSAVNFGSIAMGEEVKVVFRFRNTGNKPLFLTNVKAGCGCTVPDYTKGAIAPGTEGEVTGAFDSNKSQPGEVRKNIFVTANTNNRTDHTLIFTGFIREKVPATK